MVRMPATTLEEAHTAVSSLTEGLRIVRLEHRPAVLPHRDSQSVTLHGMHLPVLKR
jgi:hypothetical protein